MRRLAKDFLACLVIQILVLGLPAAGQHAAMAANTDTVLICKGNSTAGPADVRHADARACCQACMIPSLASPPRALPFRKEMLRATPLASHARGLAPAAGANIKCVIRGPPACS